MIAQKRISKHDRYVLELSGKIKDDYDYVSMNVELKTKKRQLGEIDIVAQKGNRYDLYEVKCSPRIVKARKQLAKLKKHFNQKNTRTFFYCGNSKMLVLV